MLACAPGELHDLPLIVFGLALAARGWSITYLGPDTPIATIEETLRGREQTLVVISAMTAERFRAAQAQLAELATGFRVALAGAGATSELAAAVGAALLLDDDPVTAAERVADECVEPAPSRTLVELDAGPPVRRCGRVGAARDVPAPVVERTEAGARRLGDLYWRELRQSTFGVLRTTEGADGLEVRLLGRGPALLRFVAASRSRFLTTR